MNAQLHQKLQSPPMWVYMGEQSLFLFIYNINELNI